MVISRLMLSATLKRLGLPGVVGVALLVFSLSLAWSTLLPSWQELDRRRASATAVPEIQREFTARGTLPDDFPADLSLTLAMNLPSSQGLDRRRASGATVQENQREAHALEPLPDNSPAGQLLAFYATFPIQADATESLSHVYAAAEGKNLQLLRGEYALSTDRQTGLVLYRLTLPVSGSYTQIREFVAAALRAVPTLALDELTFERPNISETQVQARVRLTLYLRSAS